MLFLIDADGKQFVTRTTKMRCENRVVNVVVHQAGLASLLVLFLSCFYTHRYFTAVSVAITTFQTAILNGGESNAFRIAFLNLVHH